MNALLRLLPAVLLFILLLLEPAFAGAPPLQWQKTFGGSGYDTGYSVQQTTDDGYIITGYTSSFGPGDPNVYLIKTDPNGDIHWQKNFGGSGYDYGSSVQQTTDGGYIIVGETFSFGSGEGDVYLIKTEPNGNIMWQKTFGGSSSDYGDSVQQTFDGGYIIAGKTSSFDSEWGDVYLIKTDSNGNSQWQKTFGERGTCAEWGCSVQQTSDGGYVIAGGIYPYYTTNDPNIYLVKTDPNGNSQWQKTFGGSDNADYVFSVQQTTDGGYILAGETNPYDERRADVYLIKTDPNGNSQWQKTFGGSESDYGRSVQQTADGGYVIAGHNSDSNLASSDVYLIKSDPNGNSQWQKTFGQSNYTDIAYSAQQTSDGGYVIVGYTYSYGAGDNDVYLIKLCSDGTLSADFNCNGTVYYEDLEILLAQWLQPPDILSADIYPELGDGIVNGFDFAALAHLWLQTSIP